jgi:putative inorganic carbon (HCO3(-)) transporter
VLEAAVVLLTAPFLLFPAYRPTLTVGALVALVLVWLLRWFVTGHPGISTPLDISLLLLLVMVPIAVWVSALPDLTLPKVTGLILGVASFRAIVHTGRRPPYLAWVVVVFLLAGLVLALLGLMGTDWTNKVSGLRPFLMRIPRLITSLPGADEGIHANELGGTLILFLPVSLVVTQVRGFDRTMADWVLRLGAVLLSLFLAAVLLLTQSRSAWVGVAAGLAAMGWLRWRWFRWLLLGAALLAVVMLCLAGPAQVAQTVFDSDPIAGRETLVGPVSLEGRVELWTRAWYAIQDFPFTGTGLGTFRQVVHVLYPLFLTGRTVDVGHVHNLFLQVALDLGLPGLIAYLGLVGTAIWLCSRVASGRGPAGVLTGKTHSWLALGVLGSLVAFHVYGLTDTVALGAKPGVAFWMLLALAVLLWVSLEGAQQQPSGSGDPVDLGGA